MACMLAWLSVSQDSRLFFTWPPIVLFAVCQVVSNGTPARHTNNKQHTLNIKLMRMGIEAKICVGRKERVSGGKFSHQTNIRNAESVSY